MSRLSLAFFGAAVLYALAGMLLGLSMGGSNDFTLRPVHAHLNLLGWASLALMGAFYELAGSAAPVRLGWSNFVLSNLGNVLAMALLTRKLQGDHVPLPLLGLGQVIAVVGMLVFGAAVIAVARRPRALA